MLEKKNLLFFFHRKTFDFCRFFFFSLCASSRVVERLYKCRNSEHVPLQNICPKEISFCKSFTKDLPKSRILWAIPLQRRSILFGQILYRFMYKNFFPGKNNFPRSLGKSFTNPCTNIFSWEIILLAGDSLGKSFVNLTQN